MSQITREQMLQVFENRCSTRYYDPNKKISQEDFAAILEFARLSPSSVGSEPWKFLVIQIKHYAISSNLLAGACNIN